MTPNDVRTAHVTWLRGLQKPGSKKFVEAKSICKTQGYVLIPWDKVTEKYRKDPYSRASQIYLRGIRSTWSKSLEQDVTAFFMPTGMLVTLNEYLDS